MLGVFAEFETNLRKERQAEGFAAAKVRGVYKGGKARINPDTVRQLLEDGVRPARMARQLGISRGTAYRFMPLAAVGNADRIAVGEAADSTVTLEDLLLG